MPQGLATGMKLRLQAAPGLSAQGPRRLITRQPLSTCRAHEHMVENAPARTIKVEDVAGRSALEPESTSALCPLSAFAPWPGQKCVVEGDPPVINGDCLLTEDLASDTPSIM